MTVQVMFEVYSVCTVIAYLVFIFISLIGNDRLKSEVNELKRRVTTLEVHLGIDSKD